MPLYKVLIVGAGPTGITASYYLKKEKIHHIVVDQADTVASSWLQTWDNFQLGMSVAEISLPDLGGLQFSPDAFLNRDQIIDYFAKLVVTYQLPVQLNTSVYSIKKPDEKFIVDTSKGSISATVVIDCRGPRDKAKLPEFSRKIPPLLMVNSYEYKNAKLFTKSQSNILVIGGGLSALSIASDINKNSEHRVFLACGHGDEQIRKNNHHFFSQDNTVFSRVLPSRLAQQGIIDLGRAIDVVDNHLHFRYQQSQLIKINLTKFDKIIFATGFERPALLSPKTNLSGLYVIGVPTNTNEQTVTLSQGTEEARQLVKHIVATHFSAGIVLPAYGLRARL